MDLLLSEATYIHEGDLNPNIVNADDASVIDEVNILAEYIG